MSLPFFDEKFTADDVASLCLLVQVLNRYMHFKVAALTIAIALATYIWDA